MNQRITEAIVESEGQESVRGVGLEEFGDLVQGDKTKASLAGIRKDLGQVTGENGMSRADDGIVVRKNPVERKHSAESAIEGAEHRGRP